MTRNDSFSVILNPAASGGSGGKLVHRLRRELDGRNVSFTLQQTRGPGHARDLAREAAGAGSPGILVVGGDGTVHEVANGILDYRGNPPPMAVLPVGTGNDFFRMVSPSRDLPDTIDTLLEGEVRKFEVGRVRFDGGERHFVNLLGLGLDVEVLRKRSGFRHLTGLPQYLAALLAAVASFSPVPLRMELLDRKERKDGLVMLGILTVGPSVAGGLLLSPHASPLDGYLDFCYVDPLGLVKVARYLPRVLRGTHLDIPEFHLEKVRTIRLSRPDGEPFFFELDGELMPDETTLLDVEIIPDTLAVLVPGRGGAR